MKRRGRASQSHYHLNLGTVKTIQRKHSVVTIHFFKVIVSEQNQTKMSQQNSYSSLSDFLNSPAPSLAPFPEPTQTTDLTWGLLNLPRDKQENFTPPTTNMDPAVNSHPPADWGPLYTPAEEERQRLQRQQQRITEQQAEKPTITQRQQPQLPSGHVMVTTSFIHQHHEMLKELAIYKSKPEAPQDQQVKRERPPTVSLTGTSTEALEDPPTPTPQPPHHPFQLRDEDCGVSVTSVSSAATVRRYIGHVRGPGSIYHKYRVYKRLYFNTDVFRHKYYRLLADFSRRPRRCVDCHRRITQDSLSSRQHYPTQD